MEENKDIITDLVETGADISGSIAGSVIGGLVAGSTGLIIGGASGPLITKAFKKIGSEIQKRFISQREEIRIGALYAFAIHKLENNIKSGQVMRTDAYFDSKKIKRSDAEEIFEGVVLSAQREYEERKVRFIGNLYANICTNEKIKREHANQLIKTSSNLSFRQFCLLQLLRDKNSEQSLFSKFRSFDKARIEVGDIIIEIRDLQQKGLISITARWNETDDNSIPIPYDDIEITANGILFCEMLSLDEIEKGELEKLNEST
ncbi:MAG: hypothetical protein O9294_11865 [Cytophagales bacterium]|jgi:hypothetical protein|nr:hypothetical protein [Cytophagales bacterium]